MTECGKTKTEKCSVTIRYEAMYRPVRITVCQMDQGHEIVKKDVYRPEEMPEQIMAEKATEYILVEIEKEGLSGENVAAREVYGYEPEGDVWLESFRTGGRDRGKAGNKGDLEDIKGRCDLLRQVNLP